MKQGTKHLIECQCSLPQFKDVTPPVFHKFVVFSVIDELDNVIPKFAQCNNCGVIHKVYDIFKSEVLMGNDETRSVLTVDDIKHSVPTRLADVLVSYQADLPTWEEAYFYFEQQIWNQPIILTREDNESGKSGKLLKLTSPDSFRIEPYVYRDVL